MPFAAHIGIQHTEVSASKVVVSLPVTSNLLQPYGVLHGGVNAVLAEEAASLGALANLEDGLVPVGVDLNVHHFRPVTSGTVSATATPEFIGRTLQTWQVRMENAGKTTALATVTLSTKTLNHKDQ